MISDIKAYRADKVTQDDISELVMQAQSGNSYAFERLVRLTYKDLYSLAFRLTGNDNDASDVLQESYLRAYTSIRKFRQESTFMTWMYRITANCAATSNTKRKRLSWEELSEQILISDDPNVVGSNNATPEDITAQVEDLGKVASAIRLLPPRLRMVVVLKDVYGLPHEAIATELGISQTAAKVRLHRARLVLRQALLPFKAASKVGSKLERLKEHSKRTFGGQVEGGVGE
ncbi:MAG: RNA polymerase sigma factor [Actinobacteria bacterium]|nr:RNA polymerase sigma factor [Actinomycetota bacterium]MCL6104039.1 RNA polymerase sigma factor [Actinomycetota bacterium]